MTTAPRVENITLEEFRARYKPFVADLRTVLAHFNEINDGFHQNHNRIADEHANVQPYPGIQIVREKTGNYSFDLGVHAVFLTIVSATLFGAFGTFLLCTRWELWVLWGISIGFAAIGLLCLIAPITMNLFTEPTKWCTSQKAKNVLCCICFCGRQNATQQESIPPV